MSEVKPTTTAIAARNQGFQNLLAKMEPDFASLLGGVPQAKRLAAAVYVEARKNPRIMECTPESVYGALAKCAAVGLMPGSGAVWLIPYGKDLQAQPGYLGWIEVAKRNADMGSIETDCVFQPPDEFRYAKGSNGFIHHVPGSGKRMVMENLTHAYCIVKYPNGTEERTVLDRERIEYHRSHSKGASSGNSPWSSITKLSDGTIIPHYFEMAKVCAIREAQKTWPKNDQLAALREMDMDTTTIEPEGQRAPFADTRDITELTAQLSQKATMTKDELEGELG